MEAVIGLIGVVVGWAAASATRFWATRRDELAAAATATALLEEELRLMQVCSSPARLATVWDEHRVALVRHLRPADYQRLAKALDGAAEAASLEALRAAVADLSRTFWGAHQAFILTPLIDYLRRETLSKRLNAAMERSGLPEADAEARIAFGASAD